MKRAILFLLSLGTIYFSLAQESSSGASNQPATKEDYLKKSKRQRTGAILLITSGGAIAIAGFAVAIDNAGKALGNSFVNSIRTSFDPYASPATTKDHRTLSSILIITGVGAMLGSISMFVSAHKYKLKALSFSFKNETAPQLKGLIMVYKFIPSLTLKMSL